MVTGVQHFGHEGLHNATRIFLEVRQLALNTCAPEETNVAEYATIWFRGMCGHQFGTSVFVPFGHVQTLGNV